METKNSNWPAVEFDGIGFGETREIEWQWGTEAKPVLFENYGVLGFQFDRMEGGHAAELWECDGEFLVDFEMPENRGVGCVLCTSFVALLKLLPTIDLWCKLTTKRMELDERDSSSMRAAIAQAVTLNEGTSERFQRICKEYGIL